MIGQSPVPTNKGKGMWFEESSRLWGGALRDEPKRLWEIWEIWVTDCFKITCLPRPNAPRAECDKQRWRLCVYELFARGSDLFDQEY